MNHERIEYPIVKLGSVLQQIKNGLAIKQSKIVDGLPITRIETISTGEIDTNRVGYAGITALDDPKWLLQPGDILFSHINSEEHIGKVAIYDGFPTQLIHGMNLLNLRAERNLILPRFLLRVLRSDCFRNQLCSASNRSVNQASVSITALSNLEIPLPPLPEQKQIAEILDKADSIRRKRQEAASCFEELYNSLFLTYFAKELGSISWSPLDKHLIELRYGTSNKSSSHGNPTLRIPNVVGGDIDLRDLKYVPVSDSDFDRLTLRDGDLLFVRTNGNPDNVGRCAVFDEDAIRDSGHDPAEFIYASYLIRGRLDLQSLKPLFLQHFLQTDVGRKALRDRCRTSAGQYNINTKGIGSIEVPDVTINRQQEFVDRLMALKQCRRRLLLAADGSEDLFNSLVQRAFRGEL
jgi:type I restriction enzyme S subunit